MKRSWAILVAAIGIGGCAPAEEGVGDLLGDDEQSLRPEGAWTGEQLDAVAWACREWGRVMVRGRACRISPSGRIALRHEGVGWSGSPDEQLQIGEDVQTPEHVAQAAMHLIAALYRFGSDDAACSVTSSRPPRSACWGSITPLDVERCRIAGACR